LLCNFLHSPVTSSLFGPNIFLSTLFSNTLNRCQLNKMLLEASPFPHECVFVTGFGISLWLGMLYKDLSRCLTSIETLHYSHAEEKVVIPLCSRLSKSKRTFCLRSQPSISNYILRLRMFHGICKDKLYDITRRLLQVTLNSVFFGGGGVRTYVPTFSYERTISVIRVDEYAKKAEKIKLNQTDIVLCWT
jgi:hypothetical protein